MSRITTCVAAFGAAFILAACAEEPPPEVNRGRPTALTPSQSTYVPGESAIYCYRTLAAADCYSEPQPGPPNRFIGGYTDQTAE